MAEVSVIDYGMGNLHSIVSALREVGASVQVITRPEHVAAAERVVLPGVGAFGRSMRHLSEAGLDEALQSHLRASRPLLGICLGYQVLFDSSDELGEHEGLGIFEGKVRRFQADLHVPHMGWNIVRHDGHHLFADLSEDAHAYFVHSHRPVDVDPSIGIAHSEYGGDFVCAAARGTAAGVQFHPEKSGPDGLGILSRFMTWRP